MRRMLAALAVAFVLFCLAVTETYACGDKFLVVGRNVKRVPKARHPASILLYMRAGSSLPQASKEMKLEATLRQAGHDVSAVAEDTLLRQQLATGRYAFVLADLSDAAEVARDARSSPGAPEVVPVVYQAVEDTARASQDAHGFVIKAGKSLSYLSALDEAMGRRQQATASR